MTCLQLLFAQMMQDVSSGGGYSDALSQASYALGYNLAVEYLANPEKTWLLDSFQRFSRARLEPQGVRVDWEFLEVHALGEKMFEREIYDVGVRAPEALVGFFDSLNYDDDGSVCMHFEATVEEGAHISS